MKTAISAVVGSTTTDAPTGQQEVPAPPAARPSPGNDPAPAVDPATGKPDEPHAVEAPGSAEGGTSDAEGASRGEPTSTAPPALPDDWAKRVADALFVTCVPAADAAACASPDDIADLSTLTNWCFQFIRAIEEQNA